MYYIWLQKQNSVVCTKIFHTTLNLFLKIKNKYPEDSINGLYTITTFLSGIIYNFPENDVNMSFYMPQLISIASNKRFFSSLKHLKTYKDWQWLKKN